MLYKNIVEEIESLILSHCLNPGDKLPSERELAIRSNVSRTVVREAIKILEQKGLVEVRQGKGVFIIKPRNHLVTDSIQRILGHHNATILHLVEARESVETAIIRLASERIQASQLNQLDRLINLMQQSFHNIEKFLYFDHQFHTTLAEATQNPIYLLFVNSILELIQETRKHMIFHSRQSMERAQDHHRNILAALQEEDQHKALQAMHGHMQQIREDVDAFKHLEIMEFL